MKRISNFHHHLSFKLKAVSKSHLRVIVLALVLITLLTLLLFTAPTPTELIVSTTNNLRYEVLKSSDVFEGEDEGGGGRGGGVGVGGEGREKCLPHQHIFFLKIHKCASSTLQNIFLRYGYNNNLTVALRDQGHYLGHPKLFEAKMVSKRLLPMDGKADLFTLHTRFNFHEHSQVLHSDTKWVTIVRNPETHYESMYSFYKLNNFYGMELSQFGTIPMKMLRSLPRYNGKHGKNAMLFDLGYPDNMSATEVKSAIVKLDGIFDQVMVSELMDESLVLLRRLLCWSFHDVVVFTKNARREEVKPTLKPQTLQAIRELNSADVLLYDHFLARHQQAVLEFGAKRMADEVSALQTLRDEYYKKCVSHEVKGHDSSLQHKEFSGLVSAYVAANNSDQNCLMLSMSEIPLIDTVRKHQQMILESERTF